MEQPVRGTKYYVMKYKTFNGLDVMHITDVLASHERNKKQHGSQSTFEFFELDRLDMTMNFR
jgi:hypothetical protein